MEQQNITAVKGIGEKTAKLFQKIGVETVEELLHYYPRAYDEFKESTADRGTEGRYDRGSRRNPGKNGGCGAVWSAPAGYDGWIAGQPRHTGAGMVQYALSARDAQGGGTLYFPWP